MQGALGRENMGERELGWRYVVDSLQRHTCMICPSKKTIKYGCVTPVTLIESGADERAGRNIWMTNTSYKNQ